MRNGFQFVARIPYPVTEPKRLLVASEVATLDFLRSHNIPVPKIYGYSPVADNAAGTEYIFMELVRGHNLGDIWLQLGEKARIVVLTKLVELESRLFALQFPANGSLYYPEDLEAEMDRVDVPAGAHFEGRRRFCVGPETTLKLWYGRRRNLRVRRGPYRDPTAALTAGARKEIAYLTKVGRPLQLFQRLRREIYNYQPQSHLEHIENLEKYLQIASHLVPPHGSDLARPTIRHPDLQSNNVFVADDLEITGLIDWQHCSILPLFLQCGIPDSFQNYGDVVSESLQTPELPCNFDKLNEREQFEQVELLRKRQLHYFYVSQSAKLNPMHYAALTHDFGTLRRKLFCHASDPWEGDNITLKMDLIELTRNWSRIVGVDEDCPITYSQEESDNCLRLYNAQVEADEQFQACRDIIGVGPEGWVPSEQYGEAKQREQKLKADALEAAESDAERATVCENWIFDDFDEEEYM
ncbi:hypothetical protein PRK78_005415 [Emydomyces testavorans]|uniref:Aminoglycoside phosphotransferase domain-containing protein n=1 Tax=Emydomyces testavorans TaxID=2070801 RepID=A0AAF0DKN6_9EURO|nr:hypothetical protein PRK78_005415 [Emydomyces testavorans]